MPDPALPFTITFDEPEAVSRLGQTQTELAVDEVTFTPEGVGSRMVTPRTAFDNRSPYPYDFISGNVLQVHSTELNIQFGGPVTSFGFGAALNVTAMPGTMLLEFFDDQGNSVGSSTVDLDRTVTSRLGGTNSNSEGVFSADSLMAVSRVKITNRGDGTANGSDVDWVIDNVTNDVASLPTPSPEPGPGPSPDPEPDQDPDPDPSPGGTGVVINEFRSRGPDGATDEFIELRNDSAQAIDIGGWVVDGSNGSGGTEVRRVLGSGIPLDPGCHYLLTNSRTPGYSGGTIGDNTYGLAITDDGGLQLRRRDGSIADSVGMSAGSAFGENQRLDEFPGGTSSRSYARTGNDTNNNRLDFGLRSSTPQNRSSSCAVR